ncbi:MAG: AmmeMemoRadiSam system radical SAM enzyme [Myxococcales bacterium]|nr:MAG: AmmeMemoRadiSam system radical SAM enzyme [Myxococcales bacterium]
MKEAMLYTATGGGTVRCGLCAHRCAIKDGGHGVCGVRVNQGGVLYTANYDKVVATHVDPIEKKPLFHYKPGSLSYSIATAGCNFRCTFCQNYHISQWTHDHGYDLPGESVPPEEIVRQARSAGCETIAFTYTEPTIFAELAYDTAKLAAPHGIDGVFVSNGYMTAEMVDVFGPLIKAANIDLKAFREASYRETAGAKLQPVLDSIRYLREKGVWVEVTTLVIPGFNDEDAELKEMAEFLAAVDAGMPWHLSAFHPTYHMLDRTPTGLRTLHRAHDIGRAAGLKYVYCGNVPGNPYESTLCPSCSASLIEREGYRVRMRGLSRGHCAACGEAIPGVFG